jgi:hypothetical protein
MTKTWRSVLTPFGIGLAYALAVALMTWPGPLQLSQRLIGNNIDNWIFYWNNWWIEQAIASGQDWFWTPYLFFPQGVSLVAHSHSFLNSLLALVIKPLVGPVVAYNLVLLFGLWVGGVGMFLLVYEITRQRLAAFVAGFIFAFAPYHLTQALAHAHLGSIHWWPFYALFFQRALRRPRIVDILCAGLFAGLTLWSGLQLAVLLALWSIFFLGWYVWREMELDGGWMRSCFRSISIVGLIAIVALVLSLPIVLPIVREWHHLQGATAAFDEGTTQQTDLLAYLVPPTYHPLVGSPVVSVYERFLANRASMPYLGYTVLGLCLLSLCSRQRRVGFWLVGMILWMVLAAGSALRLNGTLYSQVRLPYHLVGQLFPISAVRSPDRFNLLVVFSIAVLAGIGLTKLAAKSRWALIGVVLLVAVEYLSMPMLAWDMPPVSPFYEQMAQEETPYGVVDVPMGYSLSKLWLYYQTLHGKPLVEGHVSRYTSENYAFIGSNALLYAFYQKVERPPCLPEDALTDQLARTHGLGPALRDLNDVGVRYILLHKPNLDPTLRTQFQRVFPGVPIYEDATLAVYDIARPLPVTYDEFPFSLAPDVVLLRFDVQPADQDPAWRVQILAQLLAPRTPLACQIRLTRDNGDVLTSSVTLFGTLPQGEPWQPGDLDLQEFELSPSDDLRAGAYRWNLACSEGVVYTAPDILRLRADGRTTYLRRPMNLQYGDSIRLSGYRWQTVGADLRIMLLWEALQKPPSDYKVFVHLLNAEGEMVAQYDAMPCQWQCPTSQWQAGGTIVDRASVSLTGLPAGEYHLAAGLYGVETGERLLVQGPGGEVYPDGYPILPDVFVISLGAP